MSVNEHGDGPPHNRSPERPGPELYKVERVRGDHRWGSALLSNLGLVCAFASMLVFSILLIDRVADALFAFTALVSIAAGTRDTLRASIRQV